MRHFLDVIDREIDACRSILPFCSSTWSLLTLPSGIDRSNIISDGYIYGDFTFRLDRSEILELFMGERLYSNPYAFIRELLQNSIDAVRLRKALHPKEEFDDTIEITTWKDASGFLWIKINDSGVGMDEEIIHDYFLRVGRSYYRSAEVQADLSRSGVTARGGFAAISRFGVGILSCFTVADTVEVSTRRLYKNGIKAKPLRLSVAHAEDFFTLRRHPMTVTPMPNLVNSEESYREEAGTSIALRVNPARAEITAEALGQQIKKFAMLPPVAVRYNGEIAQLMPSEVLDFPLISSPALIELSDDDYGITSVEVAQRNHQEAIPLFVSYIGSLKLGVLPIQIDYRSPIGGIRGELVAFMPEAAPFHSRYSSRLRGFPRSLMTSMLQEIEEEIPLEAIEILNSIIASASGGMERAIGKKKEPEFTVRITFAAAKVHELLALMKDIWINEDEFPVWSVLRGVLASLAAGDSHVVNVKYRIPYEDLFSKFSAGHTTGVFWCHNGISLPGLARSYRISRSVPPFGLELEAPDYVAIAGILSFTDGLRPDVSVSRNEVVSVPYELRSALQISVRRAALAGLDPIFSSFSEHLATMSLISDRPPRNYRMDIFLSDPCMVGDDGWSCESVIPAIILNNSEEKSKGEKTKRSVVELRQISAQWPVEVLPNISLTASLLTDFYDILAPALVQIYLDVSASFVESTVRGEVVRTQCLTIRSSSSPTFSVGLRFFRPLFFIPYDNDSSTLKDSAGQSINANHPFAQWLVEQAELVDREAPVLLTRLADALDRKPSERQMIEINQVLDDLSVAIPGLKPPSQPHIRFEAGRWI